MKKNSPALRRVDLVKGPRVVEGTEKVSEISQATKRPSNARTRVSPNAPCARRRDPDGVILDCRYGSALLHRGRISRREACDRSFGARARQARVPSAHQRCDI